MMERCETMALVGISEALKLIEVSKSTLYRDLKSGKVSATKDETGKRVIDTSELIRVYGEISNSHETENDTVGNSHSGKMEHVGNNDNSENDSPGNDISQVVSVLEDQVSLLKEQLAKSESRGDKLMEMLQAEQEKNKQLMIPSPKKKFKLLEFLGFQSN